jgi:hypothetical protein
MTTPTTALRPRPEVMAFARLMEQKLRENDHKGHWRGYSLEILERLLREELEKLKRALMYSPPGIVARRAANVANFAMMIADNCGGLK